MKEAMHELAERRPGWVLLDLMLPDGCGSEVLGRIRQDGLESRVCVITGCLGPKLDQLRAMGVDHILLKPLNVERLLALMGRGETDNVTGARAC